MTTNAALNERLAKLIAAHLIAVCLEKRGVKDVPAKAEIKEMSALPATRKAKTRSVRGVLPERQKPRSKRPGH